MAEQLKGKRIVRDDVILLNRFVTARFYFEDFLELVDECGGYLFLDQLKRYYDSSFIKKLQDSKLMHFAAFNNYKFGYISSAGLKFLKYKDYEEGPLNKKNLSAPKLKANPSEKQLLTSALKFEAIKKENLIYDSPRFGSLDGHLYRDTLLKKRFLEINKTAMGNANTNEENSVEKIQKEIDKLSLELDKYKNPFFDVLIQFGLTHQRNLDRVEDIKKEIEKDEKERDKDGTFREIKDIIDNRNKKYIQELKNEKKRLEYATSKYQVDYKAALAEYNKRKRLQEELSELKNSLADAETRKLEKDQDLQKVLKRFETYFDISKIAIILSSKPYDPEVPFSKPLFYFDIYIFESGNTNELSVYKAYDEIATLSEGEKSLRGTYQSNKYDTSRPDIKIKYITTTDNTTYIKKFKEKFTSRMAIERKTFDIQTIEFKDLRKYKKNYVDHHNYIDQEDLIKVKEIEDKIARHR